MHRKAVRILFFAVAVGLVLQYAVVGLLSLSASEPWPAVLQPGFKNVWDGGDTVRIPRADLEVMMASGQYRMLPLDRLFEGVPASHHLGLLRAQFQPASLSGSSETERAASPDTRRWLIEQMGRLYPGEHAVHILATWKEVRYDRTSQVTTTHALDTLVIQLGYEGRPLR